MSNNNLKGEKMRIKNILLLVIVLTLFGCSKYEPKCNCGIIKSQGFHSWANPGYWKLIKNDCSGNSATFYFRLGGGTSIGDHFCLSEGTSW